MRLFEYIDLGTVRVNNDYNSQWETLKWAPSPRQGPTKAMWPQNKGLHKVYQFVVFDLPY